MEHIKTDSITELIITAARRLVEHPDVDLVAREGGVTPSLGFETGYRFSRTVSAGVFVRAALRELVRALSRRQRARGPDAEIIELDLVRRAAAELLVFA